MTAARPATNPAPAPTASAQTGPAVPQTYAEIGLSPDFVQDLILKTLYVSGTRTGQQIADSVALTFALVDDDLLTLQQRRFVEVRGTHGPNRGGYVFDLTQAGRDRAREALQASQYVGPTPVPLAQYTKWVESQSIVHARVNQETIRAGFNHLVLSDEVIEALGPAINSAKSLFLYGHPGNGKTAVSEAISGMLGGTIFVPYAVEVDGQIMTVFDPVHHELVEEDRSGSDELWIRQGDYDRRYARVRRPIVLVGGELTLDQLDLQYDPYAKMYQAPFQLKANGGVLIVDDFGRQRMPPRELLNRWIVPLEKRVDYLTLHTGGKFPVPFDCLLIFATNLNPHDLVEEAFLRRIHYKIEIPDPTPDQYREIFRRCADQYGVPYRDAAVDHVYQKFYSRGIAPRSCHPRDLVTHVKDIAKFLEVEPELSDELLDRACHSYFLGDIRHD